jgi:GH24 family phage-related lysozyme (muramidase)
MMTNRFLEKENCESRKAGRRDLRPAYSGGSRFLDERSVHTSPWAGSLSAADRVLVILIENGGVDLGIPALVDQLLSTIPGIGSVLPDSVRARFISFLSDKIKSFTDSLLENAELSINRYTAAKPEYFGDVIVLRDGSASYQALKDTLIAQSRSGKLIDLIILTHGSDDFVFVAGGVNSQKIRAIRTEFGKPLSIRSVYMMNCVGSSLNQAWLDSGAKASSGSIRNNYLPEPTMYFYWQNWQAGQNFETAVTSAYRKTINLMNDAVRGFLADVGGVAGSLLGSQVDFESFDFVRDSAPVIQGQRSVTINSDDLTFTQSLSSSLATTVLPLKHLRALALSQSDPDAGVSGHSLTPAGVDFIKGWEGFRDTKYNDAVGHCTIGYGTLLHTGNCDGRASEQPYEGGISEEKATQLLAQRAADFEQTINSSVSVALNQNQFDALVSFVYNIGSGGFQKSTLLRLLNQGEYASVPTEMKKWVKARQNGNVIELPGLVKRRNAEADLFQKTNPALPQSLSWSVNRRAQSLSTIDYSIPGTLPVITQPTPYACWAAVFTMMYSWKNDSSTEIRDALARVGPKYVDLFDKGAALDANTAKSLYNDAGLVPIYSFNPTIEGWESLLRQFGPLYIDVGYNAKSAGTHAIIVTAISGDGSPDHTSITYVDPAPGSVFTITFKDFLAKYEAQSAVQWPYTIVHWPGTAQTSIQNSLPITQRYAFRSPSHVVTAQSNYSIAQNPAAVVIAGMEVADAAQVGLGAIAVVQAQVSAAQGSFTLTYDKAQRLLTNEARSQMPGSQTAKQSFSRQLFYMGSSRLNAAEANIIIEWEGNPYGEIGTPIVRRDLSTSTEWSKSSANTTITKVDRIPLPQTDPRTWPIVFTYEGTYDPWGNGYFEFSGEFEINAFGGLKFNRHQVVSRALLDFAIAGAPEEYVVKGQDVFVSVPTIPQEQVNYLKTKLP